MSEELSKATPPGALARREPIREGFENMGGEDRALPRLAICQAMSPQRKKSSPLFVPALSEGDFFDVGSGKNYGAKVEVIPLLFGKSRIYFRPMSEGGGILCRSFNAVDGGSLSPTCAACPNSQWKDGAQACTLFHNYLVLVLPDLEPLVMSLKSATLKAATQWNNRLWMLKDPMTKEYLPIYGAVWRHASAEQTNPKGTFFGPTITFARFTDEKTERPAAREFYAALKGRFARTIQEQAEIVEEDGPEDTPF